MAASTNKNVVLRRFDREALTGFVNPQTYLQPSGVELLTQAGAIVLAPYEEIKAAFFVREFNEPTSTFRVFATRPKMQGVWLRMRFRDGDVMDGVIPNNLLQLDTHGFTVVPPNPSSNNQRVFVPRAALAEVAVLGVVGSPLKPAKTAEKPKEQIGLFE